MKIDAYTILVALSVLVVLSYLFNYLAASLRIPSVLLLIASGMGLKYAGGLMNLTLPHTQTLLELLGVVGLIFIVLEASLDLKIERHKLPLIGRAFLSALILMAVTAGLIALIFADYYDTTFRQALLHAIPLSVISSAIAIPSVNKMEERKREFIVYESTFSDIVGIIAFNYVIADHPSGLHALGGFSLDLVLIVIVSIVSTMAFVFLLNHATAHVRFFLTFAILILTYSFAKFIHLPSLILVLCLGLVLNNFTIFDHVIVRRFLSFSRLSDATKELKLMTAETAFIIRTFFFLLFGYSMNLALLKSQEVIIMGLVILVITILLRFLFLRSIGINSTTLSFITPRGLITILLFYSIPAANRMEKLSEGVLFIVIVSTGLAMTIGLMISKKEPFKDENTFTDSSADLPPETNSSSPSQP